MGYVGLPLAQEATRSGLRVIGLDTSEEVVAGLEAGRSHIDDLSDDDVAEMRAGGFRATTDPSVISQATAVVICVPTPLTESGGPDLGPVHEIASVPDPYAAAASADVCVLVQNHSTYDVDSLAANARRLLDTRGVVPTSAKVERL